MGSGNSISNSEKVTRISFDISFTECVASSCQDYIHNIKKLNQYLKMKLSCKADLLASGSTDKSRKLPSLVKLLHDVVRDVRLWNDNERSSYICYHKMSQGVSKRN